MKASVVDLRYRMNDVLRSLDRNEEVQLLYHGKVKGVLRARTQRSAGSVRQHPFFRMKSAPGTVQAEMAALRGGRHRAV